MDQHLSVSEAREFTGKSESTIKRLLREITGDPQHPDRPFVLPSADEVERRKTAKEPYVWKIDRQLLLRRFPQDEVAESGGAADGKSTAASAELVMQVLQEQLKSKDEQLRTLEKQLDRKDDQIANLNERMRESNVLMFLLLSKMFWRNDHSPAFELRNLGVNTLGLAETLATKEIKQKLVRVAQTLLDLEIIALPSGVTSVRGLFTKRAKGVHVVQFPRGDYFERVTQPQVTFTADESPLVEPLEKIGFDRATIRRILGEFSPRLIAEWSDITLAAVERKLIKESPPAYFQHYIRQAKTQKTTPPDWWRELQKPERTKQADRPQWSAAGSEQAAFEQYLQNEARDAFETVMDRLFQQLKTDGQDEVDARSNADRFARMHLSRQFRTDHPEFAGDPSASLSQLIQRRNQSPN